MSGLPIRVRLALYFALAMAVVLAAAGWFAYARVSSDLGNALEKALALSTGESGGFLVPPDVSHEVVWALRARSAVLSLGPTVVPLAKSLDVVSLSSGASAAYVAEGAPIPPTEETFVQSALLTPKELAALARVGSPLARGRLESERRGDRSSRPRRSPGAPGRPRLPAGQRDRR